MTVRSKRLLSASAFSANAVTVMYTAQPGETVLIKQLVVLNRTVNAGVFSIGFGSTSISGAHWWKHPLPAETAMRVHDIWVVLQPGNVIWARSDNLVQMHLGAYGAELEGVAD